MRWLVCRPHWRRKRNRYEGAARRKSAAGFALRRFPPRTFIDYTYPQQLNDERLSPRGQNSTRTGGQNSMRADNFCISKEQFQVFAVARANSSTVALCRQYDFELSVRPRAKAKAGRPAALLQIDSGFAEPNLDFVGSRVALVLEEDASTPIRNRHQLALLMASLVLALTST